jgi:hypothetical protein
MDSASAHLKIVLLYIAFFSVGLPARAANRLNPDEPPKVAACSAPEYRT